MKRCNKDEDKINETENRNRQIKSRQQKQKIKEESTKLKVVSLWFIETSIKLTFLQRKKEI